MLEKILKGKLCPGWAQEIPNNMRSTKSSLQLLENQKIEPSLRSSQGFGNVYEYGKKNYRLKGKRGDSESCGISDPCGML